MKTLRIYFRSLIMVFLFSFPSMASSQNTAWEMLYLGKTLTSDNKYAVGENCIIFSETSSNEVYAFSTVSGIWDSAFIATTLSWTDAAAAGSCAMLLNDSLAVFFSATNHDFTVLRFEGQVRPENGKMFGCNSNMAYVVTNTKIYVFDSDDSQIRSANYVSIGPTPYAYVYNGDDFLCLNLAEANLTTHTLVAYSSITKSISEYTDVNIHLFRQLEHGFIFGRTAGAPYHCGGYSAYTGTFVTRTSDIYIDDVLHQYDLNRVYPRLCYLFRNRSEVIDGIATLYLWVYNVLSGTFDEFSYDYHYDPSHLIPSVSGTGGQGIFHTTYDKDNWDKVNLITYDVYSRLFTQHDFNIVFEYGNAYYIGGHIVVVTTRDKLVFYDFLSGNSEIYNSDWQEGQFPNIQLVKPGNNYATVVYYKSSSTQGMTVINYNGTTDNLKDVSFASSNYFSGVFGTADYSLVTLVNYTQAPEHLIYSVVKDSWLVKNLPVGSLYEERKGYYSLIDNNQNTTTFFDAKSGNELILPVKNQGTYYSLDRLFVFPGNDQKYYGYSSITNTAASHQNLQYSGREFQNLNATIFIYHTPSNPSNPSHLLFDGNQGIFVSLNTNAATHGSRILTKAGGNTALTVYNKGYLFAYDPMEYTFVDQAPYRPDAVYLDQNLPNPFNTGTTIVWRLPKDAHVVLKVFDFTGRELKTLVDCDQTNGEHRIYFDASELQTGVYFYQLQLNGAVETRKMILLK